MRYLILTLTLVFTLSGCMTYDSYLSDNYPTKHIHEVTLTDIDGKPVDDFLVKYSIIGGDTEVSDSTEKVNYQYETKTNNDGEFTIEIDGDETSNSKTIITSTIIYKIPQQGSFESNHGMTFLVSSSKKDSVNTDSITVYKKRDYFTDSFLSEYEGSKDYQRIVAFLGLLKAEGLLSDNILEKKSIEFTEFRNDRFLSIGFRNTNEYNSLQLSSYEVGSRMFDGLVRSILNPLHNYLSEVGNINGYQVNVRTRTRNFVDDYDTGEYLDYNFYLPKGTVKKYKNKGITGQKLLDESIVLFNDERIEIDLQ